MINTFQMNPVMGFSGSTNTGSGKTTGNAGEGLFSILLDKINSGSEDNGASLNASIFEAIQTNTDLSTGSTTSSVNAPGETITDEISDESSGDLVLSDGIISQLTAFLENKGFTAEQINGILLSSKNDQGLMQIDKLVTAMNSARSDALSANSGLLVEAASVPEVEGILLDAGMGLTEIKEAIEVSMTEDGGLDLDKLTDALSEQSDSTLLKSDLISLFNQNNIDLTSKAGVAKTAEADSKPQTEILSNRTDALSGVQAIGQKTVESDMSLLAGQQAIGRKTVDSDMSLLAGQQAIGQKTVDSDINPLVGNNPAVFQWLDPVRESQSSQVLSSVQSVNTSGTAAVSTMNTGLNNELLRLIENPSKTNRAAAANIADMLREKGIPETEIKSFLEIVNTEQVSTTVSQGTPQEGVLMNETLLSAQAVRKGNDNTGVDIAGNMISADPKSAQEGLLQVDENMMDDQAGFSRQGGQMLNRDALTTTLEGKAISATEGADDKEAAVNFMKETNGIDIASQRTTRVSETVVTKTQEKSAYTLPDPLPKVVDRMVLMSRNGEQTGRLMIQPPELGRIDIDLSINNGHVQASLSTETYAVKEIIESNLNQLKQQLTDQGLIVEQFNVSVGSQHRQFEWNNGQAWNNNNGSSGYKTAEVEDPSDTLDDSILNGMINSDYRIDLHV